MISRLTALEAVIERGFQSFIEVGEALAEVREDELWREAGYTSWSDYLDKRWNFGASRARQIINASSFARELDSVTGLTLSSERQAREIANILSQYPEEVQRLALEGASKHKGGVTPERIQAHCEVLMEYAVTGHVTAWNGDQNAIEDAISSIRREQEMTKHENTKLVDTTLFITRVKGVQVTFELDPRYADRLEEQMTQRRPVRLVIYQVQGEQA